MIRTLLVITVTSLLAIGCSSQNNNPTGELATTDESPAPWPTEPDEPRESDPDDGLNSQTLDPRAEQLKSLCQAFHAYNKHFGHFPPAASTNGSGKRLLSWRVHILPFVGEYELYERFRLDEAWDSEHNRLLVAEMPTLYRSPDVEQYGHTSVMVFTGENTVFGDPQSRTFGIPLATYKMPPGSTGSDSLPLEGTDEQIEAELKRLDGGASSDLASTRQPSAGPTYNDLTDGTSNTLLAVYAGADKSVPWSKPDDLPFHPEDPTAVLGSIPVTGILAVFWDSQVKTLPKDIDRAQLNSFIDSTELARTDRDTSANDEN